MHLNSGKKLLFYTFFGFVAEQESGCGSQQRFLMSSLGVSGRFSYYSSENRKVHSPIDESYLKVKPAENQTQEESFRVSARDHDFEPRLV